MEISVALGGGGARGNSHIGVLRRLEKEGYIIRSIAGTSFGGLVAVFYALGNTPDHIQTLFEAVDQSKLFVRGNGDGPSLYGLSNVSDWLDEVIGAKKFIDLKLPCAVTAVDASSGREVVISEGNLKDAILSTIALPGIFPAHRFNGWELMDGGVTNPVPVTVARTMSPNLPIVAVALNDPLDKPLQAYTLPIPSVVPKPIADRITRTNFAQAYDIFMRAVDVNSRALAHYRLELDSPDVIIRPKVDDIGLLDKVNVAEVAQLGEQALERALPDLKRAVSWPARIRKKVFGQKR